MIPLSKMRLGRAVLAAGTVAVLALPVQAAVRAATSPASDSAPRVTVATGVLQGTVDANGIRSFKGIPYAAPPIGPLRWRAPQPPSPWQGVRQADAFGPRAMQPAVFPDMQFRSDGMSEDCLYLNVWTPAQSPRAKLPVLVYIFGGGYFAGDGSETRYDGAALAAKGIVTVTVNYRLGIFGFYANPELSADSQHHSSGNYGLLDQAAALQWVHDNIAAFGGDPKRVTIAGESAGSFSVSLLMASPLTKHLIAGAIGESGAMFGFQDPRPLADAEQAGAKFAATVGAANIAALRSIPAAELMADADRAHTYFGPDIDGYFLPETLTSIYDAGRQAHVPLLAGWNSAEGSYGSILKGAAPTPANARAALIDKFGDPAIADAVLSAYTVGSPQQTAESMQMLAGDLFIAYGTWKWIDEQASTGGKPVYRYYFTHAGPPAANAANPPESAAPAPPPLVKPGAWHSLDIAYFLGNLGIYTWYAWTPTDFAISRTMQGFIANFVKTGDPNGPGLPHWPRLQSKPARVMHLGVHSEALPEQYRDHYATLESLLPQLRRRQH